MVDDDSPSTASMYERWPLAAHWRDGCSLNAERTCARLPSRDTVRDTGLHRHANEDAQMSMLLSPMVRTTPIAPIAPVQPSFNADLTHLVGHLELVHVEGDHYHLRFGDAFAPEHGVVDIGMPQALRDAQLAAGDLVDVTGKISANQMSFTMDGTLYDVDTIRAITQ